MSEENAALSVTVKAGAGYEAPWIVVRADDPETLKRRLNAVLDGDLTLLVSQASVGLQAGYTATKTLGAQPIAQSAPVAQPFQTAPVASAPNVAQFPTPADVFSQVTQAQAQVQTAPAAPQTGTSATDKWGNVYTYNVPGAPTCPHGVRILKQGKKKDGSPYQSYICPQVDQFFRVQTDCKPIYA